MSGLFSSVALDQVRAASDIVDIIGAIVPLKRAGANFVALCPFHREKTPSFNVNPHKQIFHCFGCHKGGDVFTFIQEYENITFTEAVRRLAERAKIPLELDHPSGEPQTRFLKETLLKIHEEITGRWQNALANDAAGEIARAYLAKRGVAPEAVKLFRLGYAPESWDDTVNWAKSKNYELPFVEQAGLIIKKEGETRYYDRFRGRLIFPICDEQGRVVGFSGRILSGDEKIAKYVNSPETPIFTKGKVFFGLDKSKRSLLERQSAIICEGQLDLIACFMAGVTNVVAPQGTAFTADHARLLKRYAEEVVLCFDSDTAGQAATIRVLDHLLASGLAIRVASVPAPHDPDSYIKQFGGPAFEQLIAHAAGFFDYYLNWLCATHDPRTDKGQIAIVTAMAEAVQKTGHAILVDTYAQKTAARLGVSPDAARAEFKKLARSASRSQSPDDKAPPIPEKMVPPPQQESWLLRLVLLHDDLVPWVAEHLDLSWLQHDKVREILSLRLAAADNTAEGGTTNLLSRLEDNAARSLVTEALTQGRPFPHPQQQITDLLIRLRNQSIDREMQALLHQTNGIEMSETDLRRRSELVQRKRGPLISRLPD